MKVKLSMPSVRDIELDVPLTATIDYVRKKTCKKLGIESDLTSILCDGTRIDGKRSIGSLHLKKKLLIVDYLWARHLILWGSEDRKSVV